MALAQATATFVTVQYYLLPLCRRIAEVRGRLSLDLHHAKTGRGSDGTEAAPRSRVSELLQTTPAKRGPPAVESKRDCLSHVVAHHVVR